MVVVVHLKLLALLFTFYQSLQMDSVTDPPSAEPLPPLKVPPTPPSVRHGSVPHMDVTTVCDGLFLSDYESLSEEKIRELGVSFVVNATLEKANVEMGDDSIVEFLKLNIYDAPMENIGQYLDLCADRIHEVKAAGGKSLVHCAFGISRSVTVCLAYLVKYEAKTLRQAYFELKLKRPIIRPNEGFWRQLISFEMDKKGKASVKLIVYPMGAIPDVYKSNKAGSNYYRVGIGRMLSITFLDVMEVF